MKISSINHQENRCYLYPLAEAYVWLDAKDDQVRVTNEVGALILSNKHRDVQQIADIICAEYDVSREQAAHDVRQVLADMENQDLLEDASSNVVPYISVTDFKPVRACKPEVQTRLFLPTVSITVISEAVGLPAFLNPLFQLSENSAALSEPITLEVYDEGDRFPIVFRGETRDTGFSLSDTAVKCQREIIAIESNRRPLLIRLHAAAVATGNCGILFPAVGGSGKSTLSAYLMSRGYDYLNDDTIPLLADTRQFLPVPVSLSIKTGSWPVLDEHFPLLKDLYQHQFGDRHIKYLPVQDHQARTTPVDCRFVILPNFSPDHEAASLEEVSPLTVFQHFTTSGCIINKPIAPAHLEALVEWISNIPCYQMRYSSLEYAAREIDSLVSTVTAPPVRS